MIKVCEMKGQLKVLRIKKLLFNFSLFGIIKKTLQIINTE